MKTTTFEVRVIEPEEGFYLTQSNLEEGTDRTFTKKVFLAQAASPGDWRSATPQEKEAYEAEQSQQLENGSNIR